jgi:uncharacterized membrane protein
MVSGRTRGIVLLVDRLVLGASRHWLLIANVLLGTWVMLPWLAPALMAAGLETSARPIYALYSLQCHQLPQRSYFLFGDQLMPSLADITSVWPYTDATRLRRFIGTPALGYKVAWSDRMVSLYTPLFVGGMVYAAACCFRQRQGRARAPLWRPPAIRWFLLALLPLAVDGFSHLVNDAAGMSFRDDNGWLAALTGPALPPAFYTGDTIGSLNWGLRLVTGLLAGSATAWLVYPHMDAAFADIRAALEGRLRRVAPVTRIHGGLDVSFFHSIRRKAERWRNPQRARLPTR